MDGGPLSPSVEPGALHVRVWSVGVPLLPRARGCDVQSDANGSDLLCSAHPRQAGSGKMTNVMRHGCLSIDDFWG